MTRGRILYQVVHRNSREIVDRWKRGGILVSGCSRLSLKTSRKAIKNEPLKVSDFEFTAIGIREIWVPLLYTPQPAVMPPSKKRIQEVQSINFRPTSRYNTRKASL